MSDARWEQFYNAAYGTIAIAGALYAWSHRLTPDQVTLGLVAFIGVAPMLWFLINAVSRTLRRRIRALPSGLGG